MLPSLIARRWVGLCDGRNITLFILVGRGRSFLSVVWPIGVQLMFFFCSGVKEPIRKRIFGPVHIHLDVTVRVTNQIASIYPIISTQSSFENYAKMRLESRRLPPYLLTCDVTHSLSVESHLQAIVLHFILSIKFPH